LTSYQLKFVLYPLSRAAGVRVCLRLA